MTGYSPKGAVLTPVIAHARTHGRVTTEAAAHVLRTTRRHAGYTLARMRRDGWLERVADGEYVLAARGDAWQGPAGDRVVALCEDAPVSPEYVSWQLGCSYDAALSLLKWLCHTKGRIARVPRLGATIYGKKRECEEVACAAE